MKNLLTFSVLAIIMAALFSCGVQREVKTSRNGGLAIKDTISAQDSLEYELIVFDPSFDYWLESRSIQKSQYTNHYLKNMNRLYADEWNRRYARGDRRFDSYINYDPFADYDFEFSYRLFMYFKYFEEVHRLKILYGR
jgi:hypothetical protein